MRTVPLDRSKVRYQIMGIRTNEKELANKWGLEQSEPFGRALVRLSLVVASLAEGSVSS